MNAYLQFPYRLYLVISEADCKGKNVLKVAEQAIQGGVDILQLREKFCPTPLLLEKAKRLKELTDRYGIPLIINDNLDVAMAIDAAGVHVGNSDLPPIEVRRKWSNPDKHVGYSIESLGQLTNLQVPAADHLGISPVYSTSTKTDTVTEWGLTGIEAIRQITSKPLVAIGNMNSKNAGAVIKAGADCIAVVSAICAADHPQEAAYQLKNEIIKIAVLRRQDRPSS